MGFYAKKIFACCLLLAAITCNCFAAVTPAIKKRFQLIVQLIREDKAVELSKLIHYPLGRENPLHDIENAADFVKYYTTLFDDAFKTRLKFYNDSVIFEHHDVYGLVGGHFKGEIWIDENGIITTINYQSVEEMALKQALTAKAKLLIHPSVNTWNENIMVCGSEKLLIRLDRTDKGIRYVCWSKGKQMNEQPDLVLYNGVEEAQGTQGGWTWTFTNDGWTYVVDEVDVCGGETVCGLFLELLYNDELKSKTRLKEIK